MPYTVGQRVTWAADLGSEFPRVGTPGVVFAYERPGVAFVAFDLSFIRGSTCGNRCAQGHGLEVSEGYLRAALPNVPPQRPGILRNVVSSTFAEFIRKIEHATYPG